MSKGNLLLGFGHGAIGDIVLSHYAGEQIARARNRSPKNPRTTRQMLQRVIMKTNMQAYSFFQEICNHSFEGYAQGTECQSRFTQLNVNKMRSAFSDVFAGGFSQAHADLARVGSQFNFAKKDTTKCEVNPYIISEGSLRRMGATIYGTAQNNIVGVLPFIKPCGQDLIASDIEYGSVLLGLGLERGDQLTFCFASVDDKYELAEELTGADINCKFFEFNYYRIILDPAYDDLAITFLDEESLVNGFGDVASPNLRNRSIGLKLGVQPVVEGVFPYGGLAFISEDQSMSAATNSTTMAVACIASRLSGNKWLRSTEILNVRPDSRIAPGDIRRTSLYHSTDYMSNAINSYMTEAGSSLYLNQAT